MMNSILHKILVQTVALIIFFQDASSVKQLPRLLEPVTITQCNSYLEWNITAVKEAINSYLLEKGEQSPCPCLNSTQWMRAVYLNMTDPSQQCPSNWSLNTDQVRGCGMQRSGGGCDSVYYKVDGYSYNRVCGRIIGYQKGSTDAFDFLHNTQARGLEEAYVDGVSLTHGAPGSRQHIWTFAAGLSELDTRVGVTCDCSNTNLEWPYQVPSYVGNNYFCETGNTGPSHTFDQIHSNDPLWDGQGCGSTSTCCQKNHPPWFCGSLPEMTSDDLELRICGDQGRRDEDTIVSFVEMYVAIE